MICREDKDALKGVAQKQEAKLLDFLRLGKNCTLPPEPTTSIQVSHAQKFRELMDKRCTESVCAVCSMYKASVEVQDIEESQVPSLELLRAGNEALTTCVVNDVCYVLQPAAVNGSVVSVCDERKKSLRKKKVPIESLMSFDTGSIPRGPSLEEQLVPLTMVEENLLARYQVNR